jgi:hypothetical protein
MSQLAQMKGRSAASIFYEEVPDELKPTANDCQLEVALVWGDAIIEAGHFKSGNVTAGGASTNNFHLYTEEGDSHVLATVNGAQAVINPPTGGKVTVRRGKKEERPSGQITIGLEERVRISVGTVEFVLRFIKLPKANPTGLFEQVDLYFTKVLSISVMAAAVLLAILLITPLNNDLLSEDLFKNPNRYTKLLLKPPEKKKIDLSGLKEGAKPKDDEGKFGKKEAKKEDADPSKKGAPKVDANKREEDRKKVLAAGLLGAMGPDGAASNVFGPGGLGTGINNALGGLQGGAGMGDAHGVGGLGSRGTGPGGGGTGLGLGGLGTKGGGRGRGGYGDLDLGGRGKGSTRIVPGKTTVVGGLSKDVIGKVIQRHWNQIKFCYEKELQKDPNLQGKVALQFVIDGTGSVSEVNIAEDTMGSDVADCMKRNVQRWKFPEPQGGGQVIVTYPWMFRAAGAGDE